MITVQELINELSKYPKDSLVKISKLEIIDITDAEFTPIEEVE